MGSRCPASTTSCHHLYHHCLIVRHWWVSFNGHGCQAGGPTETSATRGRCENATRGRCGHGACCKMHPTRLDREKSTDQCVTSYSGAVLNLGTIKTRSRPIMSREGVKQSPYDPFSSQSRPQSLGHSHAPVGGERMLARTVSTPSMLSTRPLSCNTCWPPYRANTCPLLCRRLSRPWQPASSVASNGSGVTLLGPAYCNLRTAATSSCLVRWCGRNPDACGVACPTS